MYKFKILIFNIKKSVIPIFICLFTIFLLLFSNSNLSSAKSGLALWANFVVPSLLPFFIATELLGYTNIISILGKLLHNFMRPVFNVPGEGAFPFLMGIISGYPMGAKIVSNLKTQKICTNAEAERLIAFTNNSGPLFIIGTIGTGLFNNINIGILLFITHIMASITVGFVFRFWKSSKRFDKKWGKTNSSNSTISLSNLGEIISNSIISSINTIFLIGGFIVLFSVIISILTSSGLLNALSYIFYPILNIFNIPINFASGFLIGLLELTNGICNIANLYYGSISTNIILCSFLLGFSGFSIMLQILSITSKAKISIKPYIIGKLLQSIFASIYTYIFIYIIPFFSFH